MKFVTVKGGGVAPPCAETAVYGTYDTKKPYRGFDAEHERMSELRAYQVAEFCTVVYVSIADEKFASDDILYHGRENGLYEVFHVNECDFLRTVTYAEVYVLFDTK